MDWRCVEQEVQGRHQLVDLRRVAAIQVVDDQHQPPRPQGAADFLQLLLELIAKPRLLARIRQAGLFPQIGAGLLGQAQQLRAETVGLAQQQKSGEGRPQQGHQPGRQLGQQVLRQPIPPGRQA